ncbi:helix-turn-helix domain-containing protein [Halocalculus aciditolerans]|nr:hypothetical protein [Halocalculus aciditolerans]
MSDEDRALDAADLDERLNVDYSTAHIRRRCNKLAEEGLLTRVHPKKAAYVITDEGRAYLNEEYDVANHVYLDESSKSLGGVQEGANGEQGI